ncbi:hypothetical protein DOY81_004409, partial [Sarcophaga bullata]
ASGASFNWRFSEARFNKFADIFCLFRLVICRGDQFVESFKDKVNLIFKKILKHWLASVIV